MTGTTTRRDAFSLTGPLPTEPIVIEASAGTGKTYTISALATRFVVGDPGDPALPLHAGIPVDELLVVTFTRAAAAELRERIRAMFVVAANAVTGAAADQGDSADWLQRLADRPAAERTEIAARLNRALRQFDEATITTIHGFCQQALRQVGMAAGDAAAVLVEDDRQLVGEVCRDLLVQALADDPFALSTDAKDREIVWAPDGTVAERAANRQPSLPTKVERDFTSAVAAVRMNADAVVVPSPAVGGVAGRWSHLVAAAIAEIDERQRRRRQIGFDRLVADLRDALLAATTGDRLAEQLAERYSVVLVDEFQDTDRQQWQTFQRAFGNRRLVVVGDPKQAIYRFRGADVHAYLDAVDALPTSTLATNYRSDAALLAALDLLWNGAELGDSRIAFSSVAARPGAPRSALREPTQGARPAAVHLRTVPNDSVAAGTRGTMLSMAAAEVVLDDLGRRITELLATGEIERDGEWHPVTPGDIAVLVPSQARASWCAATLRTWDIPTVRARTGSVLESEAALQWRILLAAVAQPANKRRARAAARSWAFDLTADEIVGDDDDDDMIAGVQQRLAELAFLLRHRGVGALYEEVRGGVDDGRIVTATAALRGPDGDRHMADLDHIADLLVAALHGLPTEPLGVQQTLEQLTADAELGGEATMRRIETDREAVQITTIHAAKGLEYPIVMMPFASAARPNTSRPYVYNVGSERHVDVGSWADWTDDDGRTIDHRRTQATDELAGDALRTLYVAMTRARHRLEMWWAPTDRSGTSALARLLFDREDDRVLNNPHGSFSRRGGDEGRDACVALAAASNGLIAQFDVAAGGRAVQPQLPLDDGGTTAAPRLADHGGRVVADATWRTWSFTSLTRAAVAGETNVPHASSVAAAPIVGGGNDEPPTTLDGAIPTKLGPLSDVVGGTAVGTLVHQVLEVVDFTSPSLDDDLAAAIAQESVRVGLDLGDQREAVRDGLVAALHTPLGPLFDDRRLVDLDAGDRLAEATFDFELPASVSAADFGTVLTETLSPDDPLHDYGRQLAETFGGVDLRGWLTGSIDGVFRTGGRYLVVDYKTNRLQGYDQAALVEAMVHSNYPLQALLYSVGLHRFLRWRLAGYDPEAHLGGIGYLFLRGMVGAETPAAAGAVDGVFAWRPPVATIESLDQVLRGGGASSW